MCVRCPLHHSQFSKQRPPSTPQHLFGLCRFFKIQALASQRALGAGTQRPWGYQRAMHPYTGVKGQTDELVGPRVSASSSDEGTVSGSGNPEAALLQKQQDAGTGKPSGPDSSSVIPQLYLFGR